MNFFSDLPTYNIPQPVDTVYELCDVCGTSCDTNVIQRTEFYDKLGIKYVIRHHPYCNPWIHFNRIMSTYK